MPRHAPLANVSLTDFSLDKPVLVGVSGGRDSIVLLHWLKGCGFDKIIVCHLDHGLRKESRGDARFVADFAETLGVVCEISRSNVVTLAKRLKISIESAAREARYKFFARMARKHSCQRLLLAHHADDQVETFLFNLIRGSGSSGLGGMSPLSLRDNGLLVARPLLGVWREEIDAYIAAHALPFREDGSNTDPRYTRNRIRHSALPALAAALGRDFRRALWRTAELLRAEDEHLASAAELQNIPAQLDTAALRLLPLALQRRLIHAWLRERSVRDVGFDEVEAVRSLLTARVAKVNLPGDKHARRRARRIFLE